MRVEEKEVVLRDGRKILLRSPEAADAEGVMENMRITSGETYFMARYPEEIVRPVETEAEILDKICEDEEEFMIAAFWEGRLIGCCSVQRMGAHIKTRHRGGFGISIQQSFCNAGLGGMMMEEMLETVKQTHFEQIELGAFEDNEKAIHLYEKYGFVTWGRQPRAFKLKDGSYRDEIQMIYRK